MYGRDMSALAIPPVLRGRADKDHEPGPRRKARLFTTSRPRRLGQAGSLVPTLSRSKLASGLEFQGSPSLLAPKPRVG